MELQHNISQLQGIAITAQTVQSLRVLQFGYADFRDFLHDQEEKNPFIKIVDSDRESVSIGDTVTAEPHLPNLPGDSGSAPSAEQGEQRSADRQPAASSGMMNSHGNFSFEQIVAAPVTLKDSLRRQITMCRLDRVRQLVAFEIIESLDADGYLRRSINEISAALDIGQDAVEAVLMEIHQLEPAGVGARNLRECLFLQLDERGDISREMNVILDNLPLLAEYRFTELAKLCGIDTKKVISLFNKIRSLDPRPGFKYETDPLQPAMPDILVNNSANGDLKVEINPSLLPRVLVDQEYFSELSTAINEEDDTRFVSDCMRNANWLTQCVHQRKETLLKVATEIVRRQKAFILFGVDHIKPLQLRDISQAVGMHESTVCRAISNKYILTDRGLFALSYLLAGAIQSTDDNEDYAAEAIRQKIVKLLSKETPDRMLSDEDVAYVLQRKGIDIARRTVAKYRQSMNIPSLSTRKRWKQAFEWP